MIDPVDKLFGILKSIVIFFFFVIALFELWRCAHYLRRICKALEFMRDEQVPHLSEQLEKLNAESKKQ
ncbi:hypothetical protein BH11VER1_BH11VER1_22940 [soil metagenome]